MDRITVKGLEGLTAADDGRVLREDGGLVGRVRAGVKGVTVNFRFEFKLAGKKQDASLGTWPKTSLSNIRVNRDAARLVVHGGIAPTAAKKAERVRKQAEVAELLAKAEAERVQALTVADLFAAWLADGVARKDGNAEIRRLFARDVLPAIGRSPIKDLSESDILAMLRKQAGRGVTRQVERTYKDVHQMLAWAEKRKPWRALMADGIPTALVDVRKLLPDDYDGERSRVLSAAEIRELHSIFSGMDAAYAGAPDKRIAKRPLAVPTRLALWICLGTLCRIGETLMARWEHVDLDRGTWFIPRENTKGTRGKRRDHVVNLSDFTRRQFEALRAITGASEWCFPDRHKGAAGHVCLKSVSKQIGDRQTVFMDRAAPLSGRVSDNSLVLAAGENGKWTPHDLRRTGATIMQSLGVLDAVVNMCQNHVVQVEKVPRTYLRHDFEAERRLAWQQLGARLDAILAGDNDARSA